MPEEEEAGLNSEEPIYPGKAILFFETHLFRDTHFLRWHDGAISGFRYIFVLCGDITRFLDELVGKLWQSVSVFAENLEREPDVSGKAS